MWSSHIKLALTIGRGQTAYTGDELSGNSFLKENSRRLEAFQHIAKVEKERRNARSPSSDYCWPLFLPPLQHAIVAATLSSITFCSTTQDPELFMCNAFLDTLHGSDTSSNDSDDIPISLRDARYDSKSAFARYLQLTLSFHVSTPYLSYRLFILAAKKLEKQQQLSVFQRLVELLQLKVAAIKETGSKDLQSIRMLARGVCMAAHMVR